MKLRTLALALMIGMSLVGCSKQRIATKSFEQFLTSQTGHDYSIAKLFTLIDGSVVLKDKTTGEYVAYNVNKYNSATMTSLNDYLSVASAPSDVVHNLQSYDVSTTTQTWNPGYWYNYTVDVYDSNGNVIGYTDQSQWVDGYYSYNTTTETYYDGGGFTFSEDNAKSKDLDAIAASVENQDNMILSNQLRTQFGLSEDRAETLASLAVNYSKLEDSRKLTASDKEVFAKNGLGVSYSDLETAYKKSAKGTDTKSYESLISTAAKVNGTTPEKARQIMDLYFNSEATSN
jgi:hypothetical protein